MCRGLGSRGADDPHPILRPLTDEEREIAEDPDAWTTAPLPVLAAETSPFLRLAADGNS